MAEQSISKEKLEQMLAEDFAKFQKPAGMDIKLPPPCFLEMKGEYVDYVRNRSLTVRFPVQPHFANPTGAMQGGFITAAFDNVLGPLSYLIAKKPAVTLDLTTNYIRPIMVGDVLTVQAQMVGRGFATMHMSAEARNAKGKLVATATTNCAILSLPSNG